MKQKSYFLTSSYLQEWKSLDKQMSLHLKYVNIPARIKASNGVWLILLLPVTLLVGAIKYKTQCSFLFWHISLLSSSFLINSICGMLHYAINCQKPLKQIGTLASMTTSSLLLTLYSFEGYGVYMNILHSLVCSLCYHPLLEHLMIHVKHGFTYGEASVVTQAFLLFQIHVYTNIFLSVQDKPTNCQDTTTLILQVGLSCIIVLSTLVYTMKSLRSTLVFYSCLMLMIMFGVIIPLHIILNKSPILWMIELLLVNTSTVYLVLYWCCCVLVAIAVISSQVSSKQKANTSLRKYFHLLAVAVYVPGFVFNRCLLHLASGIVLALFLCLEMMRLLRLPPLSDILNQGFQLYVDEKDTSLALTPIYLLVGCSLPMWITPRPLEETDVLTLSAGVLSIGVGDCFASIVGYKWGKHKWKNSSKSLEGSAACFLTQCLFIILFAYLDLVPRDSIYYGTFGIAVVTLIEAKTDQVDNLALPLVQFCLFLLG
uniref:dolichol kinase n=1 Tax=Cacopsylla melanoneura TaxID=428564 RepID=A0A8D9AH54_9HEMI